MSFNVFSVPVTSYPQRLSATTTLVLTSVSFKVRSITENEF